MKTYSADAINANSKPFGKIYVTELTADDIAARKAAMATKRIARKAKRAVSAPVTRSEFDALKAELAALKAK